MTLLHPSRTGSPLAVWFVEGMPARLLSGESRFKVVGEPRCADINGTRYWRVRARGDHGESGVFDLRETDEGWVLAGAEPTDED